MNKLIQQGPAGPVITWSEGIEITAKLQLSNMMDVLLAQAQGVIPTGYLVVDRELEKFLTINTYLWWPRGDMYVRIADSGVVEAGEGNYKERQYSVESMYNLPR